MPETDAERGTEAADGLAPGRRTRLMRAETALGILAVLAILYTAYLAQNLVAPIVAAVVGSFIFMPLMRTAPFRFLPDAVSASIIVAAIIGALAGGIYMLAEPAAKWTERIPAALEEIEEKSRGLSEPVAAMRRASKQVEEITQGDNAPREVVVREDGLVAQAMEVAGQKGASILIFIVLLYFLLATGELLRDRIIRSAKRLTDKERARRILFSIEREISTYLLSISLINAGLGVAIGVTIWAIGLPNAMLWGVAAALLNFIPYAGPIAGMVLTGIVGFMTFDSVGEAMLAPAAYFLWNLVESQFVTPSVLGRRHTLNAAVVFVSIVFWGWMWGVIGAVLAVPILVILNTCFAQIEGLRKFSMFIDGSAKTNGPALPD
ncbi:AI-2E family transporter [Parvibaculum sp.]|uniref:AI-2E family transporter n=1 Tax=Parvibaculum sp. TaxID=2024848 RepID=UPI00272F265C|nr:AI-2E family transporter [Parvibaculum sp.]MDP2151713.1 AI-2E family transporter [Parvibaculum sp.]MDP3328275.1 AI-2E family transporter [Parvibaculum sp.]